MTESISTAIESITASTVSMAASITGSSSVASVSVVLVGELHAPSATTIPIILKYRFIAIG
jgi:hypothetical protein